VMAVSRKTVTVGLAASMTEPHPRVDRQREDGYQPGTFEDLLSMWAPVWGMSFNWSRYHSIE